jgi:tetratricopeptide (TPR) repeat protein
MRTFKFIIGVALLAILFSCSKKAEITGRVFDNFGKAIEGATVKIENTAFTTTTNKDGTYRISYVPGKVDVSIAKQGYSEGKLNLNIATESKFPAKDVTLYKMPSSNGVFAYGTDDYIALKCGKLIKQQAGFMGADSSYYVFGDMFSILKGSRTFLMDNDGKEQVILEVASNGLIVSPRSNTTPIKVSVTQVGSDVFLWDITSLKSGRFAIVTTAVTFGGLVPTDPVYLFKVETESENDIEVGINYSKKGDWENAVKYYNQALQKNPNEYSKYSAYWFIGNIFNDRFNMQKVFKAEYGDINNIPRDDYERSSAAYEAALKLVLNKPEILASGRRLDSMVYHRIGSLNMKMYVYLHEKKEFKEENVFLNKARDALKESLKLDTNYGMTYLRLGQLFIIQKKFSEAISIYEDLLKVVDLKSYSGSYGGKAEIYCCLGDVYYMTKEFSKAEQSYKKALQLDPNFESAKRKLEIVFKEKPTKSK